MACSTAALAVGLTCGEPLTTRDTVPRPTPACAATSSSVGRPADRGRGLDVISGTAVLTSGSELTYFMVSASSALARPLRAITPAYQDALALVIRRCVG